MAEYEGSIDSYALNINTPNSSNGMVIHLRGSFGMAFVHMIPDNESLKECRKAESENHFYIYLRPDAWAPLVDMLRNEAPVNFYFSDKTNIAGIFTDREPVGEGSE